MLVRKILESVSDEHPIAAHLNGITPVSALVMAHNRIAAVDDRVPKVSRKSIGSFLKDAISKHEPEIQITLLADYISARKAALAKSACPAEGGDCDSPTCAITDCDNKKQQDTSLTSKINTILNGDGKKLKKPTFPKSTLHKEVLPGEFVNVIVVCLGILGVILLIWSIWGIVTGGDSLMLFKAMLELLKFVYN